MAILTPDQRLRVFVSSTLRELADERAAVRRAVQTMRLAPVMFEMGARPHPPRNLYRAYLAQSHLFVGIYADSYGWIAPEMDVSGLEDEFILSEGMPRLVYVKDGNVDRDPRLAAMLERAERADPVVYRVFHNPDEIEEMVKQDIALLLTERFEGANDAIPTASHHKDFIPNQPTSFIGREDQLELAMRQLSDPSVRLLTLVGPGGIGKTRLAIEVARRAAPRFPDGVRFIKLASVREAERLTRHLMETLAIKDNTSDCLGAVERWIAGREMLLVLDNFEQLLDASDVVARLLAAAPTLKVLVTSRAVLRIRGEHEFFVPPLTLPTDGRTSVEESEAVRLFRERVAEVSPMIDLSTASHGATVAEICRRLDGLPLAIELAAARMKVMTADELLKRLRRSLDVLSSGARDLPKRQRTLRATIEWSYDLLDPMEKKLFGALSVFRGGGTLEAIEDVCGCFDDVDVLEGVASLIEKSLLRQDMTDIGEARFWMLETVCDFAEEMLDPSLRIVLKDRHADYFVRLAEGAHEGTTGKQQQYWLAKLEADYANLLVAAWHVHDVRHDYDTLATMAWNLALFAWVYGHMADARAACETLLQIPDLDPLSRARALGAGATAMFWQGAVGEALPMFIESEALFRQLEDRAGYAQISLVLGFITAEVEGVDAAMKRYDECIEIFEELGREGWLALALSGYGWILMLADRYEGHAALFERAVDTARELGAELTLGMSIGNLGQLRRWQGRLEESMALQVEAMNAVLKSGHTAAVSYTFLNASETLIAFERYEDAARLAALSAVLLERLEVLPISQMERRRNSVREQARGALGELEFTEAWEAGRSTSIDQGIELLRTGVPAGV